MPNLTLVRSGDQEALRKANLTLILDCLRRWAPISRAALAGLTGLNRATITRLVRDLIKVGYVHEIGTQSSEVGRPSILLELNPDAGHILSAQIAPDFIFVGCSKFVPERLWQHLESMRPGTSQEEMIECLLRLLHQADEVGRAGGSQLLGIAVGVPGLVDQRTGRVLFTPNLGWQNLSLHDILQPTFEKSVVVDNDMRLAALGEHYFGAAKSYNHVLYISAGVGLGGAMISNGEVFRGATGNAGEFGHIVVDPNGAACKCGNRGCWETLASEGALLNLVREALARNEHSVMVDWLRGDYDLLTTDMVLRAAQQGDALAIRAFKQIGNNLAPGIGSLINAMDPELVVLGGVFRSAGEYILPIVTEFVQKKSGHLNRVPPRVALSQNQLDDCLVGGVALVSQAIITQAGNRMESSFR